MVIEEVFVKSYFDIIIAYTILALVLVASIASKYISIAPNSMVKKILEGLEPSPGFMYFLFGVLIFYVVFVFIRPPQR
jgi:hypothetical protein